MASLSPWPARVAAGLCILNVLVLSWVQLFHDEKPPVALFVVFVAVWLFGAAMLLTFPTFGAYGTMAYGLLLAVLVVNMHGLTGTDVVIAAASFAAAVGAAVALVTRRRAGA